MNNNNKTSEFDELQENLNRIDLLTKRLVLSLANCIIKQRLNIFLRCFQTHQD